jgi:hypothetical protein
MPLVEPETVARGEAEPSPAEAAPQAYLDSASVRSRRLLRAVEHYRAASAARGEQPDEDELWLVLLAALDREPAHPLGSEAPAGE